MLEVELASLQSKLRTALMLVLEVESHPGQQVVVNVYVKSKTVAALKTQIVALQSQVEATKGRV